VFVNQYTIFNLFQQTKTITKRILPCPMYLVFQVEIKNRKGDEIFLVQVLMPDTG